MILTERDPISQYHMAYYCLKCGLLSTFNTYTARPDCWREWIF